MWYFIEQNGPKKGKGWGRGGGGGVHKNEFQIQKSGERKQVDEIIGVISAVSMFSS